MLAWFVALIGSNQHAHSCRCDSTPAIATIEKEQIMDKNFFKQFAIALCLFLLGYWTFNGLIFN